jgi:myo-inositol-1(or 4)-monophosphatase
MPNLAADVRLAVKTASRRAFLAENRISAYKGKDIVTEADLAAQEAVRNFVKKLYPGDTVLSEEDRSSLLDDTCEVPPGRVWVVDPVDGTVNYSRGLPFWCSSVAVLEDGRAVAGAVYSPVLDELFEVAEGRPYLNGEPIGPSCTGSLADALVEVALLPNCSEETKSAMLAAAPKLLSLTRGVRVTMSGALSLCYLASGRLDVYLCPVGGFFSHAAAGLVAEAAGCVLTDFSGNAYAPGKSRSLLAAATPELHEAIRKLLWTVL